MWTQLIVGMAVGGLIGYMIGGIVAIFILTMCRAAARRNRELRIYTSKDE